MVIKIKRDPYELAEHARKMLKLRKEQEHWTEDDWIRHEVERQRLAEAHKQKTAMNKRRIASLFNQIALEIEHSESGIPHLKTEEHLQKALSDYWEAWHREITTESASEARTHLLNTAIKAEALLDEIMKGGNGAIEIYQRDNIWEIAPPGSQEREYEPTDPGGSQWAQGLDDISRKCRQKAQLIEEKTGKGGRTSLASLLFGSPDDLLAESCWMFLLNHNNFSQATSLKMVRAVQGAWAIVRGSQIGRHTGRKAVRKMAQTRRNTGTV